MGGQGSDSCSEQGTAGGDAYGDVNFHPEASCSFWNRAQEQPEASELSCHDCPYPQGQASSGLLVRAGGLPFPALAPGFHAAAWGIPWVLAAQCVAWAAALGQLLCLPFQCVGPRPLTRREGAEPSVPGMSTGGFRSVPSRRAPSLASASCSKSLARAMSRRPDSTTTFRAQSRCCPSRCLSGGSGGDGARQGGCWRSQGLGWGHGALGVQSWFCLQLAVRFGVSHFPSVGLSVPVCGMGQEGRRGGGWRFLVTLEFWES